MSLANDHITTSTDSSAASADGKNNQQQQQQVKLIFNNTTNSSGGISSPNKNNVAIKRSASDYCDDVNNKKHKSDFKPTSSSVNINLKTLSSSTVATPTTNKNTNSDEEPQHQLNETYTLETTFNNSNNDDILSLPSSEITEEYVLFTTDVMEYMDVKEFSPQISTTTTSCTTPHNAVPPMVHNSSSVADNNVITKDAITPPPSTTTATLTVNTTTSGVSGSGDIELLVVPNVPDLDKNTVTTVQFNKQTDKITPSTSTNTNSTPSGLIRRHTVTSSSVICNDPITSSASSLYSRCAGNLQTTIKNRPLIVSAKNRISEVTQTTAKVSIGNTTISVPLLKPLNSGHLMQQSTTVGGSCLTSTQPTSAAAQLNLSKILNVKRGHGQKMLNQPTIVSLSQLQIKPVSNAKIVQAKVLNKKVPLQLKHFTNTTSGPNSSGVITISANKLATLQNNKLTTTIIQDTAATTTTTATTSTTTATVTAVNKEEYETIMADGVSSETDGSTDTQLAEEPTVCKTSNTTMPAATVTTSLASTNIMKNLNLHTTLGSNGSTVLTKFATSETMQQAHNKIPMRTSTVSIISKQNTEHGVVYTCSSGTSTSGTSTLSNIPKKPQQQQLTNSTINNSNNNNNKICLNPNAASVITIPRNISLMLAKSNANVSTSQQSKLSTVASTMTTTTTASEAISTATTSMAHSNVMAHIINSAPGKKLSSNAAGGHFNLAGLAAQRRLSQLCTETSYKQQQQQQTAILSCMAMKSSEIIQSTGANTLTSTTLTNIETTSAATTLATSSSEAVRQLTSSKRSDIPTEEKDATSHKNNNKRNSSIGVNEEITVSSNMQPVMSKEITSSVSTITSSVSTTTPSMTAISTTNTNISVSTTKPEEAHNALLKQLLQNTTMVNVPSSSSAMSSVSTMYSSSISMSAATSSTHTLATVNTKTTNNSNQTFLPTTSTAAAAAAVSTTTTTMTVTTNNNAKGNFTPARKVINVRAPSLGMVSSLEAQLARPALPPVPAAAAQNLQSTSSIAATSTANSMSSLSTPKTMTTPTTASSFPSPSTDNNNYQQQQQQQQITSTTSATTANSTVDIMDISNNSERNKQQNNTNEQLIHHINNHSNNNSSGSTNNNNNSNNNQKNNSHKSNVQIILKETSFVSNPIIQQQQLAINDNHINNNIDTNKCNNQDTLALNPPSSSSKQTLLDALLNNRSKPQPLEITSALPTTTLGIPLPKQQQQQQQQDTNLIKNEQKYQQQQLMIQKIKSNNNNSSDLNIKSNSYLNNDMMSTCSNSSEQKLTTELLTTPPASTSSTTIISLMQSGMSNIDEQTFVQQQQPQQQHTPKQIDMEFDLATDSLTTTPLLNEQQQSHNNNNNLPDTPTTPCFTDHSNMLPTGKQSQLQSSPKHQQSQPPSESTTPSTAFKEGSSGGSGGGGSGVDQRRKRKREYQKHRRQLMTNNKSVAISNNNNNNSNNNNTNNSSNNYSIKPTLTGSPSHGGATNSPSSLKKSRARKFSKAEEDYDNFIDNLMSHIRQMHPMQVLEPVLNRHYGVDNIYGTARQTAATLPQQQHQHQRLGREIDTHTSNSSGTGSANKSASVNNQLVGKFGYAERVHGRSIYDEEHMGEDLKMNGMCGIGGSNEKKLPSIQNDFYDQEFEPILYKSERQKLMRFLNFIRERNLDSMEIVGAHTMSTDDDAGQLNRTRHDFPALMPFDGRMSPVVPLVQPFSVNVRRYCLPPTVDNNETTTDTHNEQISCKRFKTDSPQQQQNLQNVNIQTVFLSLPLLAADNVLAVLQDLASLLHIPPLTMYKIEPANAAYPMSNSLLKRRFSRQSHVDTYSNLQHIMNRKRKMCRNCGKAFVERGVQTDMGSDMSLQSKFQLDISLNGNGRAFYCTSTCYLKAKMNARKNNNNNKNSSRGKMLKQQGTGDKKEENMQGARIFTNKKNSNAADDNSSKKCRFRYYSSKCFNNTGQIRHASEKELTDMLFKMDITVAAKYMTPNIDGNIVQRQLDDSRQCVFCSQAGDGLPDGPSRLLNFEVDKWVHLNCALWSNGVYETISGGLMNFQMSLQVGLSQLCTACQQYGATVKCFKPRCSSVYHLTCAIKERCVFYKNKTIHCQQHAQRTDKENELTSLAVQRRVFVERDENSQVASLMHHTEMNNLLRVGSLTFLNVGQLLPHQLEAFHTPHYIYPIGYKIIRFYWSMKRPNKRCRYICSIGDDSGRPEFRVQVQEPMERDLDIRDSTPKGVWQRILSAITALRKEHEQVQLFPQFITGEDLFGLSEPAIVRILESMPGIETLSNYRFKYGRNPLLELPLAINPTGAARAEPKQRQLLTWRKPHTQRTGTTNVRNASVTSPSVAGEVACPYSKQFVHSKSSQYKKMKQEWRNNVYLARSKIQGLGLYAARDMERHTMIIEYIGEVIRTEVSEIREKQYEAKNRGIYMFRLDEERVVDATLSGGLARYINHSCNPNCVTETVEVDRELRIIIFAKRRINRGEELSYDYKFNIEDDAHKIQCNCGAPNCRKWMN